MSVLHIACTINLTHAILPQMISRNRGTIINVSSDAAYMVVGKNAVYSGTKAFIKQFSHSLYLELMNTDVYVQALCPGLTRTDLHEKMGMSKDRQRNRGLLRWEEPKQVVAQSLKSLKRNKAICISGLSTKLLILFTTCIPKKAYYKIVNKVL